MESTKQLTILMCMYEAYGSINPMKGIAEILKRRGHKIIFLIRDIIKEYGNDEIKLVNDDTSRVKFEEIVKHLTEIKLFGSSSPIEKMRKLLECRRKITLKFSKDTDIIIKEIINVIDPHVIIVDAFYVLPSLYKSKRPWVAFNSSTPLWFIEDISTPPPYFGLPSFDQSEWTQCRKEYNFEYEKLTSQFNEWLIDEGLAPMKENQNVYVSKYLNIYNHPKELDYTDIRPLPSKFVQFDAFVRVDDEEFEIPNQLINKSGKLILLSMGTMTTVNVEMMKHLIDILSKTPHRYIVAMGKFHDRYKLSENMWGKPMLPQTKVLPLMDMAIVHGGQNGIVEAFYFGKPLIVMPICNDQFDNAQRVVEKGFGLKMDPLTCTYDELANGIDYILNNTELINRMKEISERIQSEAKSDKLSHLIEDLVK